MARKPKVSWDKINHQIAAGAGTGFGESYRPLLEIKRWNPSPISVQVVKAIPPFKRRCHFFSHSEWYLALLFAWLGAYLREQYPAWPWPHPHPEYSRLPEVDAGLPYSVGMEAICRDAGISHGVYPGTSIPYIWSIDLCLFLPWVNDVTRSTCLVSVKPLEHERYQYIDPLDRGPEKLEAERRFANQLGASYFVGDRSLYPGPLFAQLEDLADGALLPQHHRWSTTLNRFLDKHGADLAATSLDEIRERLIKDFQASPAEATFLKKHLLWHQLVDCDLSLPIRESRPVRSGGRALRATLRQSLERGPQ